MATPIGVSQVSVLPHAKKNKPKKIYEKSIKKYDYVVHVIIYHHAKLKMQQIFAQGQEKRGIQFQLLRVTIIHLRPVICY
jgi:hypothetical protein